ncbi:hypothetical protein AKJ16_DCAP22548 [Drosera capensis]
MFSEPKDLSSPSNVVDQSVINSDNFPGLQEVGTFGKSYQGNELSSESPGENGTEPKANLLISDSAPKEIVEVATNTTYASPEKMSSLGKLCCKGSSISFVTLGTVLLEDAPPRT